MNATNTTARDWSAIGIEWEPIEVSKRMGDHASDDAVIGTVQKPVVTTANFQKCVDHFGPARVVGWITHSSSLEVRSRAWFKQRWNKDNVGTKRMPVEAMREAVYNAVLLTSGSRGGRIATTVTRIVIGPFTRVIASGETIVYADLFGSACAAMIDANPGAPPEMVRSFVAQSLATAGITPPDEGEDEAE